MRRISTRILIGILTFVIGVSTVTAWYFLARVSARHPSVVIPEGWRRISLPRIAFSIPPDLSEREIRSIDTAVWDYHGGDMRLTIEQGRMGMPTRTSTGLPSPGPGMSEFREEATEIDGEEATVLTYKLDDSLLETNREGDGRYDGRYVAVAYIWERNLN